MYSPHPSELQEGAKFLQRYLVGEASSVATQLHDKHAPVLAHFLSYRGQSHGEAIQLLAGKLLLDQANGGLRELPASLVSFVKMAGLNGTCAPSEKMRCGAAAVVVALACSRPSNDWPELFPTLVRMLESPSNPEVEGAFATLLCFSENAPQRFKAEARPIDRLVPALISFLQDSALPRQGNALTCLVNLGTAHSPLLAPHADALFSGIASLGGDISVESRKDAYLVVLLLMDNQDVDMGGCVSHLLDAMSRAVDDANDKIAKLGCDFWVKVFTNTRAYTDNAALHGRIRAILPRLCQVLVTRLRLPEDSPEVVHGQDTSHDCAVPDSPEEIASEAFPVQDLRRSAAAALDALSSANGSFTVLPIILPLVQERLMHSNVWIREAGILALGVIAECQHESDMDAHMVHIFPYLLKQLVDPTPQVRRITLWAISRYSAWTFCAHSGLDDAGCQELVKGLMMRVLDRHKQVQEAACSALASIQGYALERLVPFLDYMIRNLMHAFGLYQAKNRILLCDTIGTLADAAGPSSSLNRPEYAEMLLPPLLAKWQEYRSSVQLTTAEVRHLMTPLLECTTSVVQALGQGVQPYAADIFQGAVDFLDVVLDAENQTESQCRNPAVTVCTLDLVTALSDVSGGELWALVCTVNSKGRNQSVFELAAACAEQESPQLRQSACALLGTISKGCGQHFAPLLEGIVPVLIRNLGSGGPVPVCNNASWALGELVLRVGAPSVQPFVEPIMESLIPLVNDERQGTATLAKNAAITIGRVGCVCPGLAAPLLGHFCRRWCTLMTSLQDRFERENTSRALCLMAIANPEALLDNFTSFCDTATLWNQTHSQLPPDVWQMFHDILHSSLQDSREKLASYFRSANPVAVDYLTKTFELTHMVEGAGVAP